MKSSFCHSGGCVEVDFYPTINIVEIGDGHSFASFSYEEWDAFIKGVKNGEFDVD